MSERSQGDPTPRRVTPPDVAAGWPEPPILALNRERAVHAFDWGLLAALGVALAYGLLWELVELNFGLIAVAVMGGWLIGAAVTRGAWKRSLHIPDRRLRIMGALLGAGSWLVGAFVAYLVSQVRFPNPSTSLLERLSFQGLSDYLTGVVDVVDGIAFLALVFVAWRSVK
jgi:hypothetical protein